MPLRVFLLRCRHVLPCVVYMYLTYLTHLWYQCGEHGKNIYLCRRGMYMYVSIVPSTYQPYPGVRRSVRCYGDLCSDGEGNGKGRGKRGVETVGLG